MKKEKKNGGRVKFWMILGGILAPLLFAAPCGAQTVVGPGETLTIDGTVDAYLLVYGTANLCEGADFGGVLVYQGGTVNIYSGAYVDWFIYAYGGSTVNIYGGGSELRPIGSIWILASDPEERIVTVYGTDFAVDNEPWGAPTFVPDPGGSSVLTGLYGNGDLIWLEFYSSVPIYLDNSASEMVIDIKPGSDRNVINLKSNGVVPVAILTTDAFDAATVDPTTALFAKAEPVQWALEDVDGDGDEDMLFHFKTQELDLNQNSTEATLTAQLAGQLMSLSTSETSNGATVSGTDKVQVLSSKSKK